MFTQYKADRLCDLTRTAIAMHFVSALRRALLLRSSYSVMAETSLGIPMRGGLAILNAHPSLFNSNPLWLSADAEVTFCTDKGLINNAPPEA